VRPFANRADRCGIKSLADRWMGIFSTDDLGWEIEKRNHQTYSGDLGGHDGLLGNGSALNVVDPMAAIFTTPLFPDYFLDRKER